MKKIHIFGNFMVLTSWEKGPQCCYPKLIQGAPNRFDSIMLIPRPAATSHHALVALLITTPSNQPTFNKLKI